MRDIIYQEIRECNRVIAQETDEKVKSEGNKKLARCVEVICELSKTGRKKGLLALEEIVWEIEELENRKHLRAMMTLVIDGADPNVVEEISTARYFALGLVGYEALEYLVTLLGCLLIQAGDNPRIIEDRLLAMVPEEVTKLYKAKMEEQLGAQNKKSELDLSILEKFYKGGIGVTSEDTYYFQVKITDYALRTLDDKKLQRLLRDVDNNDLKLAMLVLSGKTRHHIFDNLSERLAVMIAEEMEEMGIVRMKEVGKAIENIFSRLDIMIRFGEIESVHGEAFCLFNQLFEKQEEEENRLSAVNNELHELMLEYDSSVYKLISNPWKNS